MKNLFYRRRFIFFPFAFAAFVALTGFVVMTLWNYLLPSLLHVGMITFWQAVGVFVLCKILFGFGGRGHRMGGGAPWMRHKMEDRFKNFTPEEKERFKAKMDKHFCGRGRWGRDDRHRFDTEWDNYKETEKTSE